MPPRPELDSPYPPTAVERVCDRWFPRLIWIGVVVLLVLVFLGERLA